MKLNNGMREILSRVSLNNLEILGDTGVLDNLLDQGKITPEEHSKIFASWRVHGMKGDIFPFCVGASDAPLILGRSKYKSPGYLQLEKENPEKYVKAPDAGLSHIFLLGHLTEEANMRMNCQLLSERINQKVEFIPCKLEFRNKKYPNIVVHTDGMAKIGDKYFLLEAKHGRSGRKSSDQSKVSNIDLAMENMVGEDWNLQIQVMLEILEEFRLSGAFLMTMKGMCCETGSDFNQILVETDKQTGENTCKAMQQFVYDTVNGIKYSFDVLSNDVRIEEMAKRYLDAELLNDAPVFLHKNTLPSFKALDELDQEEAKIRNLLKPIEDEYKARIDELSKKIEDIKKSRNAIHLHLADELKGATKGILKSDSGTYQIYVDSSGFAKDASVMKYFKQTYPDVYEDIRRQKPKIAFKVKKN